MKRFGFVLVAVLAACASPETPAEKAPPPERPVKPARAPAKPGPFKDPFAAETPPPSPPKEPPEKEPEPPAPPAKAPEAPAKAPETPAPEAPAEPEAPPPSEEPEVEKPTLPDEPQEKPDEPEAPAQPRSRPAPLEKGTLEPSQVEAGTAKGDAEAPELTDEQIEALPRVQILRGLLAQKERRLADTLRDLAAARQTNTTERTLSSQSLQLIENLRAENTDLKRKLALATAGFDPSKSIPVDSNQSDNRFRMGGNLDPDLKVGAVNGEVMRLGDLLERLYFTYGFQGFNEFVSFKLVEQEAKRRKIAVGEAETLRWAAKKMAEMAAKAGGEDKFRELVKQEGKSLAFIDAALRKNGAYVLRIERLVAQQRATPEGRKALEAIAKQVYADEYDKIVEASHIFYRADESDTAAVKKAREKAEIVVNRIQQRDARFEDIARAESEDENSKDEGGDLGKITPKRFDDLPAFTRVLFSLPKGQLSVVQSKVGIHVVRIDKIVPPSLTWPQAKPRILRQLVREGATAEETAALLDRLNKKAKIERELKFR